MYPCFSNLLFFRILLMVQLIFLASKQYSQDIHCPELAYPLQIVKWAILCILLLSTLYTVDQHEPLTNKTQFQHVSISFNIYVYIYIYDMYSYICFHICSVPWQKRLWRCLDVCCTNCLCFILRTFQQTPGAYPKPPTNSLWRNSFHLGVWGFLGYAPGVCWGSVRFIIWMLFLWC